jgi:hypothetical protein
MSKYDPLKDYLTQSDDDLTPMGFSEIEQVLGFELPPSSRTQRAWWSNNPTNNVMTRAWLEAGYETEAVDMKAGRLVFRKTKTSMKTLDSSKNTGARRHPAFGALKGLMTMPADLDLTQPAAPEWVQSLSGGLRD